MPNGNRRELFVKQDGRPARFFLHRSIHHESQRQKLRVDIEAYGGRVASNDDHVDTVLISATCDRDLLRFRYGADDDEHKRAIHVERLSFVQHCIQQKRFEHRVPVIKGMGGRPGRKRATEFTASDDEHLVAYLARMQPRKEAGGRSGNRIYQRLVKLGNEFPESYSWAKRHTFHAWRERYKKYQHIFDPEIEKIAKAEGTYDNPLWLEDRRMSGRRLRGGHIEIDNSEEEEEELALDGEEKEEELAQEEEREASQVHEEEEQSPPPGDERSWDMDEYVQDVEVLQDGDWGVQDVDLETKKRKRVQDSPVSDQIVKKRRSGGNVSPSHPASAKGKEIAHESDKGSDDDDGIFNAIEDEPISGFEIDEPGPSNVLLSPDRTLAEPSSRSSRKRMSFTQETLVDTQSRMEFEPLSHSTSANGRHSGKASRSQPISHNIAEREEEPLLQRSSPPSPQLPHPPPSTQQEAPGTSRREQHVATETNKPARIGPKPRSKQRSPLINVQPNDAPYKNTRARSQSVEPIVMPPPKFKSARRKRNSEAAEQEVQMAPPKTGPTLIAETIEEEMDVESILMTKESNQSTSVRVRDPSLDTDDAQTRQDLRASGPAFFSRKDKAANSLHRYKSSGSSRRYSLLPLQQPPAHPALDENSRPRRSGPQALEPRTPMNVSHARQESVSSADSFPLKGTKAFAEKKKKQEQEKRSPYKPPEGTRAAQLASR